MFCKNCGKQIPDGAAHCPECGTAQQAAPQQAAPQQAAPQQAAPMNAAAPQQAAPAAPKMPKVNLNAAADFNKSVNVGGKKIEFTLANIIPMAMLVLIMIAMIGIHSFNVVSIKTRSDGAKKWVKDKSSYDAIIDEVDDDDALDDGFTSFMKFFEVFTEIVAIAGVAGCVLFINKDNIMAIRCLGISAIAMFLSYFMMFIYAFHVKSETKDLMEAFGAKVKGGPTLVVVLWLLISLALAACSVFAPMIIGDNKKNNTAAPASTPAGGFGGFNA